MNPEENGAEAIPQAPQIVRKRGRPKKLEPELRLTKTVGCKVTQSEYDILVNANSNKTISKAVREKLFGGENGL